MDAQKQQVVAKLKEAKNVLVTVSADPSVDQLAACLGLTLMLNKLGKHATAVFSGQVPSTIEFLKPEETLESNTNSLRDFIIALDKNKADKLRYKVEDKVVRIFITPYKTSISQDDLEFSEGDFNVDAVVALGVKQQADIDQAVTAQGNILHDATVITITSSDESALGSIHWRDPAASGVSELAASLSDSFDKNLLDEQIATAFLTGIVAQTERFSNSLTTSNTMKISAQLMSAGANQQLVAAKLEEPEPQPEPAEIELPEPVESEESVETEPEPEPPKTDPGLLEISHDYSEDAATDETEEKAGASQDDNSGENLEPESADDTSATEAPDIAPSEPTDPETSAPEPADEPSEEDTSGQNPPLRKVLRGKGPDVGQLTANETEEPLDPSTDPFSLPPLDQPILEHYTKKAEEAKLSIESPPETPKPEDPVPPKSEAPNPSGNSEPPQETLKDIENSVHSPHVTADASPKEPELASASNPFESTVPPEPSAPEPAVNPLPSVSVDANGTLIHHGPDNPPLGELHPAPGFASVPPASNTTPLAPSPDAAVHSPDEGEQKPPDVPPPFIPPS